MERLEPRTVMAAEADVFGNGISIPDGDTSPRTADGTDFGPVDVASGSVIRNFFFKNVATAGTLSKLGVSSASLSGPDAGSFQLVATSLPARLSEGQQVQINVTFDPSSIGTKRATVVIANSDPNEDPYEFAIQGTGAQVSPEISVQGLLSRVIVDGDITPDMADGTNFGEVQVGTFERQTFSISNSGIDQLNLLGNPTVKILGDTQNFVVADFPSDRIPRNTTTYFDLDYRPRSAGTHTATIEIRSNDITGGEDVYTFQVTGVAHRGGIVVTQIGGGAVENGITTIDLGTFERGKAATPVVINVRNQGTRDIRIADSASDGEPTVPSWVNITDALTSTIFGGGSDNFALQLKTSTIGTFGQTLVTFTTDDPTVGTFTFMVTGTVIPPAAPVTVGVIFDDRPVTDNDRAPLPLASFFVGATQNRRFVFTVINNGPGQATFSNLTVPAGLTVIEGISASLAAGVSDTFTVEVDTGVARSLRGAITFQTNDTDPARQLFQINVSASITAPHAAAPSLPVVQLNSPNNGAYAVGDTVTFRGSATHPAGISHIQVELYQDGTSAAHRIGIIHRGEAGDGNRDSVTWTIPATLEGRVLGGRDYRIKWIAWSGENAPQPAADFSDGTFTIDASHVAQPTFAAPWGGSPFAYYDNRSFYCDNDHLGADIQRPEGAAIQAGVQGVIKFYGPAPGYGNLLAVIEVDLGSPQTFTNAAGNPVTTQKVLWIFGHLRKSELNGGGGQVLSWDVGDAIRPTDTIGFIERDLDNGDGAEHVHLGLRLQSFDAARTTDGGKFARGYRINADGSDSGMQQWFANPIAAVQLTPTAPQRPTALDSIATGPHSIKVSWLPSVGAQSYLVYRAPNQSGPWQLLPPSNVTSVEDTNLLPATTYFYRVAAVNTAGTSEQTGPISETTLASVPRPTGLHVGTVTDSSVQFMWDDVIADGSGGYELRAAIFGTEQFAAIQPSQQTRTSTVVSGILPNTEYEIRLFAFKDTSNRLIYSAPSDPLRFTPISGAGSLKLPQSLPEPPLQNPRDIARVYMYNFNGARWTQLSALGQDENLLLGKQVILLTHGWDDKFDKSELLTPGSEERFYIGDPKEYMEVFAREFERGSNRPLPLSDYVILAVDWYGASSQERKFGSDPNNIPSPEGDFAALLWNILNPNREPWNSDYVPVDSRKSAENGIEVARLLAPRLLNAGLNPANSILIGHSNGGGFMGSLATSLMDSTKSHNHPYGIKTRELVALDTPWLTSAWDAVQNAAPAVEQISNYHQDVIRDGNLSLSFGANMRGANVANFVMNNAVSDKILDRYKTDNHVELNLVGHSQVPFRYAHSADGDDHANPWGFQQSFYLLNEVGWQSSQTWKEKSLPTRPETITTPGSGGGTFLPPFNPPITTIVQVPYLDNLSYVDFSTGYSGFQSIIPRPSPDPASGRVTRIALGDSTFSGNANAILATFVDGLGNSQHIVRGVAASPVHAAFDLALSADADELAFRIDVLNPGNNDVLHVAIDGNVIGTASLLSAFENGGLDYSFDVSEFSGQTRQLTFFMPSDEASDAEFLISNVSFWSDVYDRSGPELINTPPLSPTVSLMTLIDLQFDELIDETLATSPGRVQLTGASGSVAIDGFEYTRGVGQPNLRLLFNQPPAPGAYDLTIDADGIRDLSGNPFNNGQDYVYSFNVVAPPQVEGVVWKDENGDGVRQGGEMLFAGANVHLVEAASGARLGSDVTDALGRYQVPGQLATNYYVEVELPAGQRFTAVDQGSDEAVDSDVNAVSGRSPTFAFTASGQVQTFDAGLVEVAGQGHLDLFVAGASGYGLFGDGMGGFSAAATLGGTNGGVAVGDFNEDGAPDLILINAGSSLAILRFGLGNSQFGNDVSFAAGEPGASIQHAASADLNKDGHVDLIANGNGSNKVYVHFGRGDGTFAPFATYAVGNNPRSVAAGDFNADGWLDLATNNDLSGDVSVLLNQGDGTFAAATAWSMSFSPRGIAVADFNGDGRADIATSNQGSSSSVTVRLSLASGGFTAVTSNSVNSVPSRALTSFDFDGDLDIDLATADEGNNVTVLLNNGAGVFTAQPSVHPVAHAFHLAPGDFNGDGRADLAVTDMYSNAANYTSNSLAVMYGNGAGGFSSTAYFPVTNGVFVYAAELNGTPQFGSIGDFVWTDLDGDGLQDAGEPGLPGIAVNLRNAADEIVATTTADAAGHYQFTRVPRGDYQVEVVKPDGFKFSPRQIPFGISGRVDIDFGGRFDDVADMVIQLDGKVVVVGSTSTSASSGSDFAIVRLNVDGSVDTTFGIDGRVIIDFGSAFDGASAVAIQPDGRIVVVGSTGDWSDLSMNFAVARLTSDGILDTSFDGGGKVITALSSNRDRATGVVIQPDGKIVVAGYANNSDPTSNVGIVRYLSNGSLDVTFDGDGIVSTAFSGRRAVPLGNVVLQPDGKIVLGADYHVFGGSDRHFAVVRFESTGQLDSAFGEQGLATATYPLSVFEAAWGAVAVQTDGRILVSGISSSNWIDARFGIARFTSNGTNDVSFGNGGLAILDFADGREIVEKIQIQAGGRIIAVGPTDLGGGLVRFNTNGTLDVTFGNNGRVDTGISSEPVSSNAGLAFRPDGSIVIAGTVDNGTNKDFAIKSYSADGQLGVGSDLNSDVDPATGRTELISVAGGSAASSTDAGLIPLRNISGTVWNDRDGDGLREIGESLAVGVGVELRTSAGAVLATTVSGPQGNYEFADLAVGLYQVGFVLPNNSRVTLVDQGNDDSIDSDVDRASGQSAAVSLTAAGSIAMIDAGLVESRFLGDRVWEDLDGNGVQDLNEPAIDQVAVEAYTAGGDGMLGTLDDVLAASTSSDSYGAYHFSNLADGQYRLVFTPPAGFVPTQANVGDDAGADAGDSDIHPLTRSVTVAVAGAYELRDVDAGFYRPATISGQKWNDLDGDGQHDGDEPSLNGWSIELRDQAGMIVFTHSTADLDVNGDGAIDPVAERGWYTFGGLRPGVYRIGEVQQQGWLQTYPLPEETLLADDFIDNSLDTSKWFVTLPFGSSSVTEAGGRLEFRNRGYLISQQQFDPRDLGELRMTGRWQFTNASFPGHDYPQIFTRSDGVPFGTANETLNGIQFHINGNDSVAIVEAVNGTDVNLTGFVPFTVNDGDEFEFEARDDGTNLRFTVTRLSDGNSITLSAQSTHVFAVNHVVIHNRETTTLGYLDDFRLTAGSTAYTVFLESGGQDSGRHFGNQAVPGEAPVVDLNGGGDGTGFTAAFTENSAAVAVVGADAMLTDADSQFLRNLTATIANPADGAAEMLDMDPTGTGLEKSYAAGVLTVSGIGSVADYQRVLRTLTYLHTSENPTAGDRAIHVVANDGLHEGLAAVATVAVTAVNDRPTIAAPASITVDQGIPMAVPNVSVSDVDLTAVNAIDVTIAAQHGVIELGYTGGLQVVAGANGSASLTIRGVSPDLNTALALLSYTSDANFYGMDTLSITVDDRGQFGIPGAVTASVETAVTVISSNRHSPVFTSSNTPSVLENTAAVMTVTATDADRPTQIVNFAITGGEDQGRFSITSGGELTLNSAPDFEAPADFDANNIYLVQVTGSDGFGGSTVQNLIVTVTPANESPTSLTLSANTVVENAAGAIIGNVTVSDPDLGDSHIISVSDPRFEVNGGQLKLKAGQSLDFEATSHVTLAITARDIGNQEFTKSFTIDVTDVNETTTGVFVSGTSDDDRFTVVYSAANITVTLATNGGVSSLVGTYGLGTSITVNGMGGVDHVTVALTPGQLGALATADVLVLQNYLAAPTGTTLFLLVPPTVSFATLDFETATLGVHDDDTIFDLTACIQMIVSDDQIIVGGDGSDDVIYGANATDLIFGQGGDDSIYGLDGADCLFGGAGHDAIFGGNMDDLLLGGSGDDSLVGDSGYDRLLGGPGADQLDGGMHDDQLDGGPGQDTVLGGPGYDILKVRWDEAASDVMNGGDNTDTIVNDTAAPVVLAAFDAGVSSVEGWSGNNQPIVGTDAANVLSFLVAPSYSMSLSGVPYIDGRGGNDTITGTNGVDNLRGGDGDDVLFGLGGVDTMYGDAGNDSLHGGDGVDYLYGGDGVDTITTGAGRDFVYFAGDFDSLDTITDFALYSDTINLQTYATSYSQLTFTIVAPNTTINLPNGKKIRLLNWSRAVTSSQFRF